MAEVIADRDVIVHDPLLDIDRKVLAGQPVPPDLVEVYEKAGKKDEVDGHWEYDGEEQLVSPRGARKSEKAVKGAVEVAQKAAKKAAEADD